MSKGKKHTLAYKQWECEWKYRRIFGNVWNGTSRRNESLWKLLKIEGNKLGGPFEIQLNFTKWRLATSDATSRFYTYSFAIRSLSLSLSLCALCGCVCIASDFPFVLSLPPQTEYSNFDSQQILVVLKCGTKRATNKTSMKIQSFGHFSFTPFSQNSKVISHQIHWARSNELYAYWSIEFYVLDVSIPF